MIPLQVFTFETIGMGPAVLLVGIMALLLWSAVAFRNPLGVISWGFTMVLFVFSLLFEIPTESFWIGILMTVIIIIVGVIARWTR